MTTESTSLEKAAADRTPAVMTTPDEYRSAVLRWQQHQHHILTPWTNVSAIAPHHGLIASQVLIDPDPANKDVYDGLPFLKKDEVAIAKNGLSKLEEMLGISHRLEYISCGTIRFYWHVKAIGTYRGLDGAIQQREASQEWDLRDDSPRLEGWTGRQIGEGRKYGLRNCEERAINAMLRRCGCGIKQAYKRADLAKFFVAVKVMFIPDMSDPDIKRLVTTAALGGTAAMYPPPAAPSRALPGLDVEEREPEAEPRQVGRGSTKTPTPATSADASTPVAGPDQPPTPDAVRIVKVETKTGKTNNKDWTRYTIVDSTGSEHSTFDKTIAAFAEKARDAKQWVEVAEETDGQYKNLIEIIPAGEQPSLLPNPSDL